MEQERLGVSFIKDHNALYWAGVIFSSCCIAAPRGEPGAAEAAPFLFSSMKGWQSSSMLVFNPWLWAATGGVAISCVAPTSTAAHETLASAELEAFTGGGQGLRIVGRLLGAARGG